jgi:hypothetical protein
MKAARAFQLPARNRKLDPLRRVLSILLSRTLQFGHRARGFTAKNAARPTALRCQESALSRQPYDQAFSFADMENRLGHRSDIGRH